MNPTTSFPPFPTLDLTLLSPRLRTRPLSNTYRTSDTTSALQTESSLPFNLPKFVSIQSRISDLGSPFHQSCPGSRRPFVCPDRNSGPDQTGPDQRTWGRLDYLHPPEPPLDSTCPEWVTKLLGGIPLSLVDTSSDSGSFPSLTTPKDGTRKGAPGRASRGLRVGRALM